MTGDGPPTVIVAFPSRPPECWGERLTHAGVRLLQVSACATLMLAPIEGYLMAVEPQLVKVPTVLLAASWAGVRLRQRRLPQLHPVHVLLGLLAAVVLTTSAVHSGEPFTTEYALRWLPFLAVTAILVDVAAREVPLRALLVAAVAGATMAGVGALSSFYVEGDARAMGPLEDSNDLAYVLVAALPLLVRDLSRPLPWRLLFSCGVLLWLVSYVNGAALLVAYVVSPRLVAWVSMSPRPGGRGHR